MTDTKVAARWWERMLDGRHVWGSLEVSPPRYGVARYRLVVFPPGIDTNDRRLLRVWRAWPTWGAVGWLAIQIVLNGLLAPGTAFGVPTAAYLGAGIFLFTRVGELRGQVRTLNITRIAGYADQHAAAMFVKLEALVAVLCRADDECDAGQWSRADHEAAWWQVYDQLGPESSGALPSR